MKHAHFETFRPLCPVCLAHEVESPLAIGRTEVQQGDDLLEGILHCQEVNCQREYPIVDGIPMIVADIRGYVSGHLSAIQARRDLTAVTESLLGDAAGPGSDYDTQRQHLSSYCWDHYGDLDPGEPAGSPVPGAVVTALVEGLEAAAPLASGPILDLGCSVGRTSFELAKRTGELVLGIDLSFSMLRLASQVLRRGVVRYPRRRVGIVYDRREFPVRFPHDELVDFWVADAMALPFHAHTFANVASLNVLDCVGSPLEFFRSIGRVLRPEGRALVSCPFDWSPAATPVENWLGGHSQRASHAGCSEQMLAKLIADWLPRELGLSLLQAADVSPWHVRLHDRSTMIYHNHRVVLGKASTAARQHSHPPQLVLGGMATRRRDVPCDKLTIGDNEREGTR